MNFWAGFALGYMAGTGGAVVVLVLAYWLRNRGNGAL